MPSYFHQVKWFCLRTPSGGEALRQESRTLKPQDGLGRASGPPGAAMPLRRTLEPLPLTGSGDGGFAGALHNAQSAPLEYLLRPDSSSGSGRLERCRSAARSPAVPAFLR